MRFCFRTICSVGALLYGAGGVFAAGNDVLGSNDKKVDAARREVVADKQQSFAEIGFGQNLDEYDFLSEDDYLCFLSGDNHQEDDSSKNEPSITIDGKRWSSADSSLKKLGAYKSIDMGDSYGKYKGISALLSLDLEKYADKSGAYFTRAVMDYIQEMIEQNPNYKFNPNEYGSSKLRSIMAEHMGTSYNAQVSIWELIAKENRIGINIVELNNNTTCELFVYEGYCGQQKTICFDQNSGRYRKLQNIYNNPNFSDDDTSSSEDEKGKKPKNSTFTNESYIPSDSEDEKGKKPKKSTFINESYKPSDSEDDTSSSEDEKSKKPKKSTFINESYIPSGSSSSDSEDDISEAEKDSRKLNKTTDSKSDSESDSDSSSADDTSSSGTDGSSSSSDTDDKDNRETKFYLNEYSDDHFAPKELFEGVVEKNIEKIQNIENLKDILNKWDKRNGQTLLTRAAEKNDISTIKWLVDNFKEYLDLDATNYKGDTALITAAWKDNIEIVKYLVEQGADFNKQGEYGNIPLMFAISHKNLDMAKFLLNQKNIKLDLQGQSGKTVVFRAVQINSIEIVNRLIEIGVDLNIENDEGYTPLMIAAEKGYTKIVRLLTNETVNDIQKITDFLCAWKNKLSLRDKQLARVNINYKNKLGDTALLKAIRNKRYIIASILLNRGAEIDSNSEDYQKALDESLSDVKMEPEKRFIFVRGMLLNVEKDCFKEPRDYLGMKLLKKAIEQKDSDTAWLLMKKGANFDGLQHNFSEHVSLLGPNTNSFAKLDLNPVYQGLSIIQQALNDKEKVNFKNDKGETAIWILFEKFKQPEIFNELIFKLSKNGADFNIVNENSETLLFQVLNYPRLVERLIKKGMDINHKNSEGKTPLMVAAEKGKIEAVKKLFEIAPMKADKQNNEDDEKTPEKDGRKILEVDEKDNEGNTALHLALRNNKEEVAIFLIQKGVRTDIKNDSGNAPIFYTTNIDIARLLADKGIDPNDGLKWGLDNSRTEKPKFFEFAMSMMDKGADYKSIKGYENRSYPYSLFWRAMENIEGMKYLDETLKNKLMTKEVIGDLKRKVEDELKANGGKDTPLTLTLKSILEDPNYTSENKPITEGNIKNLKPKLEDKSKTDKDGDTPLISVVRSIMLRNIPETKKKLVTDLVENGADVNMRNKKGDGPMTYAKELSGYLLAHGVDLDYKSRSGNWLNGMMTKTPRYDDDLVVKSMKSGFDYIDEHFSPEEAAEKKKNLINEQNKDGLNSVHRAIIKNYPKTLELLIANGADVDAPTDIKNTALHIAARYNHTKMAELLVNHGSDIQLKNEKEETPLIRTAQYDSKGVAQILLNTNKISQNEVNDAFLTAAEFGSTNIIELLLDTRNIPQEQKNDALQIAKNKRNDANGDDRFKFDDVIKILNRGVKESYDSSDSDSDSELNSSSSSTHNEPYIVKRNVSTSSRSVLDSDSELSGDEALISDCHL